jgi:exodeoxyribonuclease VII large subunit
MADPHSLPGNIPEFSVSEISGAVKRTLEGAFGRVRVRGEITELKRYPSGHIYLSLKDEGGKLAAVVWKFAVPRLGLEPENGVEVIASGKITSYGERSTYQLIIDRLEYAGAGALLARIDALRLKLAGEGLFAPERKRALPLLPRVIGVVSSERGAVIQDIRTTVKRRFPRSILLWPVAVQGEGAAAQIAAAIAGFDSLPRDGVPRPDVLIIARGGGSLEDLMAFNDEAVVRAAAACRIPLISAVGHETDTTLIDHVSDRRAPTPTAAAELAVPSRAELAADLAQKGARLLGALNRLAQERRLGLQRAERGLPDLPSLLGAARQRLDDRGARLSLALPNLLRARRTALLAAERDLPSPRQILDRRGASLALLANRLAGGLPTLLRARRTALLTVERDLPPPRQILERRAASLALVAGRLAAGLRHTAARRQAEAGRILPRLQPAAAEALLRQARARLAGIAGQLEAVSPEAVLKRGYALVFDRHGRALTSAEAVRPGASLRLHFADGDAAATAAPRQGQLDL